MSHLTVYPENDSSRPLIDTSDFEEITEALGGAGILIERWAADRDLADDADNEA